VEVIQLVTNAAVALTIAFVGWHLSSNYRIQARTRLLELRVDAYRQLFAVTEAASPTRLGRGEALQPEEGKKLGRAIYSWYYENGNGLLMPNSTRVQLQTLQQELQGEPVRRESPDPLLQKISHLRSLLRRDVGVFAADEFGGGWPDRPRWFRRSTRSE
jgi:hypothetical protein